MTRDERQLGRRWSSRGAHSRERGRDASSRARDDDAGTTRRRSRRVIFRGTHRLHVHYILCIDVYIYWFLVDVYTHRVEHSKSPSAETVIYAGDTLATQDS